jgi:hypothetical protein
VLEVLWRCNEGAATMIDKNVLPSRHRAPCQSVSTGDAVTYTLTTASLIQMVNLSTNLINNTTAQVFRDLGVL